MLSYLLSDPMFDLVGGFRACARGIEGLSEGSKPIDSVEGAICVLENTDSTNSGNA
jgi:isoaspartyl peptidase/L-asparaginase-like protein (Ntn-hydrolase superfamily)